MKSDLKSTKNRHVTQGWVFVHDASVLAGKTTAPWIRWADGRSQEVGPGYDYKNSKVVPPPNSKWVLIP